MSSDAAPFAKTVKGFEASLAAGKVMVTKANYNLKDSDQDKIAEEIKADKPDIVLTVGTKAAKMVKDKLPGVRAIYTAILNPEEFITKDGCGISLNIPDEVKLQKVAELFPVFKKCGVIYSAKSEKAIAAIKDASVKCGLTAVCVKINGASELVSALEGLKGKVDFLYMIPDSEIYFPNSVEQLLKNSVSLGLPLLGLSTNYTKSGALVSFDCDYEDVGAQAAELTEKTFSGAEKNCKGTPRKIVYSVNKGIAEALGITLEQKVIDGAKEVY